MKYDVSIHARKTLRGTVDADSPKAAARAFVEQNRITHADAPPRGFVRVMVSSRDGYESFRVSFRPFGVALRKIAAYTVRP